MAEYFIFYRDVQKGKRVPDLSKQMEFVAKVDRKERLREKINQQKRRGK